MPEKEKKTSWRSIQVALFNLSMRLFRSPIGKRRGAVRFSVYFYNVFINEEMIIMHTGKDICCDMIKEELL